MRAGRAIRAVLVEFYWLVRQKVPSQEFRASVLCAAVFAVHDRCGALKPWLSPRSGRLSAVRTDVRQDSNSNCGDNLTNRRDLVLCSAIYTRKEKSRSAVDQPGFSKFLRVPGRATHAVEALLAFFFD